MDKDVKLGSVGDLDLSFSGGKAKIALSASYEQDGAGLKSQASVSAELDSSVLVDKLFSAIEKASPAGAQPIEETVKLVIKEAISKL